MKRIEERTNYYLLVYTSYTNEPFKVSVNSAMEGFKIAKTDILTKRVRELILAKNPVFEIIDVEFVEEQVSIQKLSIELDKNYDGATGFNWDAFVKGSVVVFFDNDDDIFSFLTHAEERGLVWCSREEPTQYEGWRDHLHLIGISYNVFDAGLSYARQSYWLECHPNLPVVRWWE